ncbi:MAG: hypothetical protein HN467_01840 [Opitutae bacterium]|nr:hypothetical protein [Opitutae bacterium]
MNKLHKRLPMGIRNLFRPLKTPIESIICGVIRLLSRDKVISGPFKGMAFRYQHQEYAMLLGTWELELTRIWDLILAEDFPLMVDVGAAEGYYAVGMAMQKPKSRILAFEMEDCVRQNLNTMKNLNGTELEVRAKCELKDLTVLGKELEGAFILMDVEGFETVLLDPKKIPSLHKSWILVELHDFYSEGCSSILRSRFEASHNIQLIEGQDRFIDDLPKAIGILRKLFSARRIVPFMDEGRPHPMSWYFMTPKSV